MREGAKDLQPTLGLTGATTLLVGGVIGSGIFLLPSAVAQQVRDPALVLLVWGLGGALSLAGALTFAELGAARPRAGGQYVYLREAFGPAPAFLFGWTAFAVNYTASIAAIAVAFAAYLATFQPLGSFQVKLVAIGAIWMLTLVNVRGVRHGGLVQDLSTFAKVAALLALVGAAFLLAPPLGPAAEPAAPPPLGALGGIGLALAVSLFAYEGWSGVVNVASEVKDPARTIPRAALLGTVVVTLVYLAANAAYLRALPIERIAASPAVAFDAAAAALGPQGSRLVAFGVVVSTFGAVNAYVLQGARISFAMARDRLFYEGFGKVHPRFATPAFGLVLQAEVASLFVLSGTFAQLVLYVVVSSWLFYGLSAGALFVLRAREPAAARPYEVPFYPWLPGAFVVASALIIGITLATDTLGALVGLGLTLSGAPVYLFLRARARRSGPSRSAS